MSFLVVLVAGQLSSQQRQNAAQMVDEGSFGIFMQGKRIGTERFQIQQTNDVGILTASITVDDGKNRAEQHSEMQITANGALRRYTWSSTLPQAEQSVVEPANGFLTEHDTTADLKKHDMPYILPPSTVILDDSFFSHRELLVWRYFATGCTPKGNQLDCGPSQFGILVPRQHTAGTATVELLGREKITLQSRQWELNKLKMNIDGVECWLWVSNPENHYRVMKISIPSAGAEVLRD